MFRSIRSTVTAIEHIVYRKSLIFLIWQVDNVLIEPRSPIEAGSLIQAEGRSNLLYGIWPSRFQSISVRPQLCWQNVTVWSQHLLIF